MKYCIKCKEMRSIRLFRKDKARRDGMYPYCKVCTVKNPTQFLLEDALRLLGLHHCADCNGWKTQQEFYKNKGAKNGRSSQCRQCAKHRVLNWAAKNPDKVKAKERRRDPSKKHMWWKSYYASNREHLIQRAVERSRTPEGKARQARANHLRRVRELTAPATLTSYEWEVIIQVQDSRCLKCGAVFSEQLPPQRDHVIPLSMGGPLTLENCQRLCRPCNSSKKAKQIDYRPANWREIVRSIVGDFEE